MEGDLGWCRGGSSSNNWDLHAVVRFACSGAATSQCAPSSPPSDGWPSPWQQPLPTDPTVDDLWEALLDEPKAKAPQPSSPARNASPTTQKPTPAKTRPSGRGGGGPIRSKRKSKKRQVNKEVKRVPAGSPSADLWAWRKYGQKPIKGSPYPRGYYRCSTDKACLARKQVERCVTDPGTLIVTYTGGEHSHPVPLHRNSLAGTTRSKPQQQAQSPPASDSAGLSPSPSLADTMLQGSQSACAEMSPATPLRSPSVGVEYEDKEDDLGVRLLHGDTEMTVENDALLFLQPDEPALAGGNGAGACGEVTLCPNNKPDQPARSVPVIGGGAEDVVLFPKPGGPQPTTVSASIENGGAGTASVMNFADEKFSIISGSGLSAWEAAAASGWGF